MAESNGKLISELKVQELRSELISRGLDGNGVKAALVARLEKALSEQGVDINSYLFTTANDNTTTTPASTTAIEAENNDSNASATAADDGAATKDETGKNKEAKKEAVLENVKTIEEQTSENKTSDETSKALTDNLIPKHDDEIDEAEMHGETEETITKTTTTVNGNSNEESLDIGDLEEREESEEDDSKGENTMDAEMKEEGKEEEPKNSTIQEISDEEDLDDMMSVDDPASAAAVSKLEKKENDEKPKADDKVAPESTKTTEEVDDKNADKKPVSAKPKIPAGLNFPSDDPHGLRCIWIRSIPIETRLSELKLAFINSGFTVESAKIFTTKQSSRPSAFGFMTLSSQDGAKKAVEKMNNSIFKGKVITVERACDASMLQTEVLPTDRPKVHPPIKPPEDTKPIGENSSSNTRSRIIVTSKTIKTADYCKPDTVLTVFSNENTKSNLARSRNDRQHPERSPYMNTVNRTRILRTTEPQRTVEVSGRNIRVVASRDTRPRSHRRSPVRPPPPRPRTPPRGRTPPRRHRTPERERHHRTPERDRVADERRKYEEMMRKKEEEFKRKEEALRLEAERNRIKLEKERLEKENLALKLKLQQQEQLRAAAPSNISSSSRRQGSPGRSGSRHRGNTPARRPSPSRRHASPPPPRHHQISSRRTPEHMDPRHHSSSSYRPEPPKDAYPSRRRSRSRSPVRGGERGYDRSMGAPRERPDEYSRSRAPEHGSSRRPRGESPIRNAPAPPPPKYERHSPRRNYESSSRTDRSRRNDPAPIEDPQRSSRSSRNGGSDSRRDYPSNSFDRPIESDTFGSTRRDNHFSTSSSNPATYNFTNGSMVNPSYSTSSRNQPQLPPTSTWPQQNYATPNPQVWPSSHQPQTITIPSWNPTSFVRNNNSNQRYGGF